MNLFYRLLITFFVLGIGFFTMSVEASSTQDEPVYTTLRSIDRGTFNEYRYKMTEQFFRLREYVEVNNRLSEKILKDIAVLANESYDYLPDDLKNKNYLNELGIELQKGVKSPSNTIHYNGVVRAM